MVTALLVGLVVGFVMVMPPGPIAMACMRQALTGPAREGVVLVLGIAAMDSGYALLAAFASSALFGALWDTLMRHAWVLLAFQGGCIVVLVGFGLHYCRSSRHGGAARSRAAMQGSLRGDVSPALSGVLLALTSLANPAFLPSLIFAMSLLHVRGWMGHAVGDHVLFALGFGVGAALWYVLLLRTVRHFRAQFSPTVIPILARAAGGVLLLCAGLLTYTVVTTTAWLRLPGW
jgi:threonine/homoserine/homoserine lactone efflux protein